MDILHSSMLFTQSGNVLAAEKDGMIHKYPVDKPGIWELDMSLDGKVYLCFLSCLSFLFLPSRPPCSDSSSASFALILG